MYHQDKTEFCLQLIYVVRKILTLNSDPLYKNKKLIFLISKDRVLCDRGKNLNV
jgi:hypothetical protein